MNRTRSHMTISASAKVKFVNNIKYQRVIIKMKRREYYFSIVYPHNITLLMYFSLLYTILDYLSPPYHTLCVHNRKLRSCVQLKVQSMTKSRKLCHSGTRISCIGSWGTPDETRSQQPNSLPTNDIILLSSLPTN